MTTSCAHLQRGLATTRYMTWPDKADDWAFVRRHHAVMADAPEFALCYDCHKLLPSMAPAVPAPAKVAPRPEHVHAGGTPEQAWICRSCEEIKLDPDEFPPLRECSKDSCGSVFVSDERNCPDCNNPFTRRSEDHGCENCTEAAEETQAATCADCDELYEVDNTR